MSDLALIAYLFLGACCATHFAVVERIWEPDDERPPHVQWCGAAAVWLSWPVYLLVNALDAAYSRDHDDGE